MKIVEQEILTAVKYLLTGKVNETLSDSDYALPLIEFSDSENESVVCPVISLSACEQSEKERIIRLDTYILTIAFAFPEKPESELYCYAYSGAVSRAFYNNPTLSGVVDKAVVTGKRYTTPKKAYCGDSWGLVINVRLTVER